MSLDISEALQNIGAEAIASLEARNAAREKALTDSRATIRFCANTIRATHRGEFDEAIKLLGQARALVVATQQALTGFPDIYWSGYVQDAQKEFSEASIVLAVVSGGDFPLPQALGVELPPYLNGLGEAVGEMRRYVLDVIRHGSSERCEEVLQVMEEIYSLLVTIDFPDALTNGLRRTTDMVRAVLERTRGDLTFTLQQRVLTQALARHLPEAANAASIPMPGDDTDWSS